MSTLRTSRKQYVGNLVNFNDNRVLVSAPLPFFAGALVNKKPATSTCVIRYNHGVQAFP